MTWIRWETGTPRSEVVAFLAHRLGVKPVLALGYYSAMCCGFGDERPDGRIADVTDTAVEHWAQWDGKRGKFAAAIREWCALAETDPGKLRGWWRNEAVLRKQATDARKPDGRKHIPPESPENPARDLRGMLGGNDHVNDNDNEQTTDADQLPAVRVAISANTGLRSNPLVRGFNELVPGQAITHVTDWIAQGIPLPLICETVQAVASRFKPTPGNEQPSSFGYFDKPVRQAHARTTGKSPRAVSAPPPSRLRNLA